MKNNIRFFAISILAATILTVTAFAAPELDFSPMLVGTFQAADVMVRELGGYAIGIASIIWAAKEFSKKSVFQTVIVIVAGIFIGLLIAQPEWLKTLGNDLLNSLKVGG